MLSGPLFGSIIGYTVPIILTSFLQLLFHAADLVVVGQFCGSISVAAVGSTGSITNLLVNLFIGLSVGVGVSVAHGMGSHSTEDVHKTVHTAVPVALVCGVFLTVIGVRYAEPLLRAMGTPDMQKSPPRIPLRTPVPRPDTGPMGIRNFPCKKIK